MTLHLAVLTSLISRNAGGLFNSVRRLSQSLESECGVQATVFGVEDDHTKKDLSAWEPLIPQVYPRLGPRALQFAPKLFSALMAANPDVVHVHGLWTYPSVVCSRWGWKTSKPHIVSPRGMLDAWALRNSSWKKKIASFLFEERHLSSAGCLHALCRSEASSMRQFGLRNPIGVVPNGVDLPDNLISGQHYESRENKSLLFLGRLHPKKGLEKTLESWRQLKRVKTSLRWQFLIAGWDQNGHTQQLELRCRELGLRYRNVSVSEWLARNSSTEFSLSNQRAQRVASDGDPDLDIVFLGPAFGNEKDKLLRSVDAFILPSYSEGLPMAVLEAWAYGLPVLMTTECNLSEGFAASAALQVTHETSHVQPMVDNSILEGLRSLIEMKDAERIEMGARGRQLVEQQFTWPRVACQMKEIYDWMIGGGSPPSTVEC